MFFTDHDGGFPEIRLREPGSLFWRGAWGGSMICACLCCTQSIGPIPGVRPRVRHF
jgi:hypothetical protein